MFPSCPQNSGQGWGTRLLQAELAERELFLTNLRAELSAFEALYLRQVGTPYAELDEWNAKIAERLAEQEGLRVALTAVSVRRHRHSPHPMALIFPCQL